jgi:hypothetical protein
MIDHAVNISNSLSSFSIKNFTLIIFVLEAQVFVPNVGEIGHLDVSSIPEFT